jgi:hypothetical protein
MGAKSQINMAVLIDKKRLSHTQKLAKSVIFVPMFRHIQLDHLWRWQFCHSEPAFYHRQINVRLKMSTIALLNELTANESRLCSLSATGSVEKDYPAFVAKRSMQEKSLCMKSSLSDTTGDFFYVQSS